MRRRLAGAAALLAILGIITGLPVLLLAIGANPIPSALPTWQDLLSRLFEPDDGSAVIWLFTMAAWIAWAFLAVSILVEVVARIRSVRVPRLPGLRLPQAAAKGLVGTAALLFAATPLIATAQPHPSSPPQPETTGLPAQVARHEAAAPATHGDRMAGPAGQTRDREQESKRRVHTVKDGDSLWSIAEDRLGDGERFREIAQLNYGRTQDDGEHLTREHWINVGWKLRLPGRDKESDAEARRPARQHHTAAGERRTIRDGDTLWDIAEETLGAGERYPEIFRASKHLEQPGGYRLTDPDEIDAGWTVIIPVDSRRSVDNRHENPDRQQSGGEKADSSKNEKTESKNAESKNAESERTSPSESDTDSGDRRPTGQEEKGAGQPNRAEARPGQAPVPVDRARPETTPRPAQPPTTEPPASAPTPTRSSPAAGAPGNPTDTVPDPRADAESTPEVIDHDEAFPVRTVAGVGALVAAGVIGLIAARRSHQQRRRPHQARLPMPGLLAAHTEQQLRAAADPLSIDTVDIALRGLARSCASSGQPLPGLRAARLSADQLDLFLSDEAELPEPWTGTVDATVWTLHADQVTHYSAEDLRDVPAPYPALVTIGHDSEDGHVLLDLEHVGSLELHGDSQATREVLAALAIELATSSWADDLQVTLVGAYPDLEEALQTGRIRYVPTIESTLHGLAERATADEVALTEAGSPDLQHARVNGSAPGTWPPDILLIAGPLTDLQRNQLADLLNTTPRLAIAAVTTETSLGGWSLDEIASGDETAVLEPVGLGIHPQRVDTDTYAHILDMVATASEPVDSGTSATDLGGDGTQSQLIPAIVPEPDVTPSEDLDEAVNPDVRSDAEPARVPVAAHPDHQDEAPSADDEEGTVSPDPTGQPNEALDPAWGPAPSGEVGQIVASLPRQRPTIRLLGPVDLQNARGTVEPSKERSLLEYAAYLVLHPRATHSSVDDAIWPNRRNQDNLNTRNTATSKLRKWLGEDDAGDPYLPRHRYAFADAVTSDWAEFTSLAGPSITRTPTANLERALALVRGRPFEGVHPRRYAWAETWRQEMISAVVDVSYELAHRRLMEGRWRAAEEAVVVGINLEPGIERLWRLRILAAHEGRNRQSEQEAIDRLLVITDQLGSDLEPETERLLAALQNPDEDFEELRKAL